MQEISNSPQDMYASWTATVGLWPSAALAVLTCLALLYILWRHHPCYGGNPGLPLFPIVGCLPFLLLNKNRLYEWSVEIFERAHALTVHVFMGPRYTTIATADPQNVHHILKSSFEFYPKGPDFYPYFFDVFGMGIFNSDGPLWRFQRKVASHIFTSNSLRDFVVDIADAEICRRLLPALDSACKYRSGCPIDLQALFMDFTFDTISQLTFGADPACLVSCKFLKKGVNDVGHDAEMEFKGGITKSDSVCEGSNYIISTNHGHGFMSLNAEEGARHIDVLQRGDGLSYMKVPDDLIRGFAEGFHVAMQITADRFLTLRYVWQIKKWLNIGSEKELQEALKAVNKFSGFVIGKCKSAGSSTPGRKDLLSRFVQLSKAQVASLLEGEDEAIWKANSNEHTQAALSDSLLKDILLSFTFAGRDTVASGITFLIWHICLYPKVEEAIHEEIKGIIRDRQSNQSGNETVGSFSYEEIRKMNYVHAALSESMRLYPPVPSDPKYAARDDVLPNGTKVCKGDIVTYNVFAMGRARQVWGADCLEFKPERWLGEDGLFVPVNPYKYPVFQAGIRTCLGKDFAYIQIKLVVASLVRDYKFLLSPGFKPRLSFGVNLSMTNGLPVIVKRRKPDSANY